ncbi:murein biosynthesis integral membrane protein MurJ [soil metagenome]
MNQLISKGKKLFISEQTSILSAASVIMVMTVASQILGLVRQRVLLIFFTPTQTALFFAAFRLPDLLFEVLIYGMFASAFIPTFTKLLKKDQKEAWDTAARVVNICLIIFAFFAIIFGIFADKLYMLVAPGFSAAEIHTIANLARVMFFAQGIFIISYVLTSVLESLRRFLIPALAPLFYNLGLILGTLILSPKLGLMAPAIGVVIGAIAHFLIQLPLSRQLGFRFTKEIKPTEGVKDIANLAAPRLVDLSFQQVSETTNLYFASLISTASYTYFTLASSLQAAPVRLFGTSLAKAALPTLTRVSDDFQKFRDILFKTIYQIFFLITPFVAIFIVLRIPTIRLFFGTSIFDWNATVETGMVLSAFAIGIPFQTMVAILARGFYALHDTKTPVIVSVVGDAIVIIFDLILVKGFGLPSWALAFSFSVGALIETIVLIIILRNRLNNFSIFRRIMPMFKTLIAGISSGLVMYYLLKFFDKWVPVRLPKPIVFQSFVLDTRYTVNLIILTVLVGLAGIIIYIVVSLILKSDELMDVWNAVWKRRSVLFKSKRNETEPISPIDNV